MIYGGIDNGNSGAIVARRHTGEILHAEPMPTMNVGAGKKTKIIYDHAAILCVLRLLAALDTDLYFVLEKAQPMPGQGVTSMFNYGGGYHAMKMALLAVKIPFDVVHPATWQKKILHGIEGGDTKTRAILKVQRALPELSLLATPRSRKPHEGLADAACMMLYAEQSRPHNPSSGRLPPPPGK